MSCLATARRQFLTEPKRSSLDWTCFLEEPCVNQIIVRSKRCVFFAIIFENRYMFDDVMSMARVDYAVIRESYGFSAHLRDCGAR